jgi:nucleotide-binding universal stress UspA family protein
MSAAPRNILLATDGSLASLKAARVAVALAASCQGRLRVLAVAEEGPAPPQLSPERREAQLRDAMDHVRRLGAEAGLDVEAVLRRRADAQPYELILEEAEHWPADLLFLGRRSHRGLGRALLGSQTEHVLEFAQLPVVVVPESAAAGEPARIEEEPDRRQPPT